MSAAGRPRSGLVIRRAGQPSCAATARSSRPLQKIAPVVAACSTLLLCGCALLSGCAAHINYGPLSGALGARLRSSALVSHQLPVTVREMPNPLRGQYEDLLEPLFPQSNPADEQYPAWPGSYDASLRVSWRQLQPVDPRTLPADSPDDRLFDFRMIDDALTKLEKRNMRLTLRVFAYNSCCDEFYPNHTNIAVPDWVAAIPGATTSYPGPQNSPEAWVTQVVPNWNNPDYLNAFSHLLAALGRRYDRDERLSVFEFSGYGDFSENHVAYLRSALGAPGPAPNRSIAELGYYSQFRDQSITVGAIRQLVAANVSAFPHKQLVVNPPNPEIVRQMLSGEVTRKLSAPVGIRSDCLGVYPVLPEWAESAQSHYVQTHDPVVAEIQQRLASALVMTEWCQLPHGSDPHAYYRRGLDDVVRYHVGMMSSFNFPDRDSASTMDPALYALWAQANASSGYRYAVEARPGSQAIRVSKPYPVSGKVVTVPVVWTNYGAAAAFERWAPVYRLVDSSGKRVWALPAKVQLDKLVRDEPGSSRGAVVPASSTEAVRIDVSGLSPGRYTLRASVDWQQHVPGASHVVNYPPMQLACDGRDDSGSYPIATLDVGSAGTPLPQG
ncbi:hypothetical protein [Mycobacterium servetii]|uniref:Secreted protein n=1 Tax=Mycobacterium servetii TaxID=3237418 RepID=A0ABV4C7G7_9MYCO